MTTRLRSLVTPSGDAPHPSGDDRLAVYAVTPLVQGSSEYHPGERRRLAETSLSGLGLCLLTLQDEHEIPKRSRVGVFDRETRKWLINPFAGTSPWIALERD